MALFQPPLRRIGTRRRPAPRFLGRALSGPGLGEAWALGGKPRQACQGGKYAGDALSIRKSLGFVHLLAHASHLSWKKNVGIHRIVAIWLTIRHCWVPPSPPESRLFSPPTRDGRLQNERCAATRMLQLRSSFSRPIVREVTRDFCFESSSVPGAVSQRPCSQMLPRSAANAQPRLTDLTSTGALDTRSLPAAEGPPGRLDR